MSIIALVCRCFYTTIFFHIFISMALIHSCHQLSQKAREIYNSFLSSKATTPVNIDSQAQLADDVLTAPRPDMFKQPQLQVRFHNVCTCKHTRIQS